MSSRRGAVHSGKLSPCRCKASLRSKRNLRHSRALVSRIGETCGLGTEDQTEQLGCQPDSNSHKGERHVPISSE